MIRYCTVLFLILGTLTLVAQENQPREFTRADTLRGMLTPARSGYDVTYYHLDVRIDPQSRSLRGANTVRFRVKAPLDLMHLDLYPNMAIDSIRFGDQKLPFTREFGAVFIQLPQPLTPGEVEEITVYYGGHPTVAKRPPWEGGFIWAEDKQGNPWVAVTCQGDGASMWWPVKDHQSDEPDSMLISVTVPPGLQNVSNGRLRQKTVLADGWTRFDWFVSYPINTYNVTVNITQYAHFGETYVNEDGDTLTLDYYVLPENLEKAREHFTDVKPMMVCFEKHFGKYPFYRDGFKLVESPHLGMEHQSAVAYGNNYLHGYRGLAPAKVGLKFDFIIVHEAAHEWWGNSVSSNDIADMWIHESFGAYAEAVFIECMYGYEEALTYINGKKQKILNDRPIIGPYHVNHPGSKDMYNKGQLVLNTLRHVLDDDARWFALLKGLHETFKYQTIDAEDVFKYINAETGTDLGYFFQQYFQHTALPQLEVILQKKGDRLTGSYRWRADVEEFRMPIKVTTAPERYEFIYPTTDMQVLELGDMDPREFRIAEDQFFVDLALKWIYLDPDLPESEGVHH